MNLVEYPLYYFMDLLVVSIPYVRMLMVFFNELKFKMNWDYINFVLVCCMQVQADVFEDEVALYLEHFIK